MDSSAFDRLSRAFVTAISRRRVLGLLTGLPLVGVLTGADAPESAAREHGRNRGHHPGRRKDNRKGQRHDGGGSSGGGGGLFPPDRCTEILNVACSRTLPDGFGCRGANLMSADLQGCDLANFTRNFAGANLNRTNLTDANLTDVNLSAAKLTFANLTRANLTKVVMWGVHFDHADMTEANLTDASMKKGFFAGANLTGAIYHKTICPRGSRSDENGGTCCGLFGQPDPPPIGTCPA